MDEGLWEGERWGDGTAFRLEQCFVAADEICVWALACEDVPEMQAAVAEQAGVASDAGEVSFLMGHDG